MINKIPTNIKRLFHTLEGVNTSIETGVTDEGDQWYAAGGSHLAIGQDARLFKDWELVATFSGADELCAEVSNWHP